MQPSETVSQSGEPILIATSEVMQQVLNMAKRAAGSDATVLIQGETGTGKELIARTIHQHSPRSSGPFVAVNCGAYTDSLLASELFGHVRGAFTGAVSDRPGVFEMAKHGTVLLDEIGSMSPAMQVKMLRVLQERTVIRVGSSKEVPVDVRVIAATHADLEELSRQHSFREDLYYRIKVVTCRLPPLRERREDIKPIIYHFLDYFSTRFNKSGVRLAEDTERKLIEFAWPGNVRQLRSELEQIVAMADGNSLVTPRGLSMEVLHPRSTTGNPVELHASAVTKSPPGSAVMVDSDATYQALLDEWTQAVVAARLERFGGNITKTAQSLAISRSTLYALLRKYGMHGQED